MSESGRSKLDVITRWLPAVIVAVGVTAFYLQDHQRIIAATAIIDRYEEHGTPQVVKAQADLESMKHRVALVEQFIVGMDTLRQQVTRIEKDVQRANERLDEHMKVKP